jgi:glycosyltransferase involved in cell wall biosynthesis
MDLCAEMLMGHLDRDARAEIQATVVRPAYRKRMSAVPVLSRSKRAQNLDRVLNRHWDFPRHLRSQVQNHDLFHICDHSYAQLALKLPPQRTGVFCYDLDAFRCLLEPTKDARPFWFRALMRRVLQGLQRAAVVFYATLAIRTEILAFGLIPEEKLVYAPLGYAAEFHAHAVPNNEAERILTPLGECPYLLHVGSCTPRKRVDFLLQLFASLRHERPSLRLIKVGGSWTPSQQQIIQDQMLQSAIVHVADIDRKTLAALYRGATAALMPSDAEGFGLPVIEALACGARVLGSDLPVLREVGGSAVCYAPVGDLPAWRARVMTLFETPAQDAQQDRLAQARRFSWSTHARIIANAYRELVT